MRIPETVRVLNLRLKGIPCFVVSDRSAGEALKTIIYYHGWSSTKENTYLFSSILAHWRYRVIIPEVIYHGERGTLDYNDPGVIGEYFWTTVVQSVDEFKGLLEAVIDHFNLDPRAIAVAGNSMGAFIASGAFSLNKNVGTLVSINGSCAWKKAGEVFQVADLLGSDKILKIIEQYDPIGDIASLASRPMLLIHGSADTTVPIECQRFFYEQLVSYCGQQPPNVKFVEVQNLNHQITLGVMEEIIDWLEVFLK
ncbi:alpha/beta fold hydrolase [Desulfosporosinus sp. PR]|uniref:prolyl oligopeptidase family serine peptidase n=1 Tax=Candidatus Desulfosporosinus nitrosoreducens TaxID=3401928 RepID=UPI0027FAA6C5|nr:prolyl oligopeptidase family serine peptidase [Desulfosporosinus sp. PR]MDQ7092865.1 alpha/beta fold hydrolase [Desulfosporosinus sp. PR]